MINLYHFKFNKIKMEKSTKQKQKFVKIAIKFLKKENCYNISSFIANYLLKNVKYAVN